MTARELAEEIIREKLWQTLNQVGKTAHVQAMVSKACRLVPFVDSAATEFKLLPTGDSVWAPPQDYQLEGFARRIRISWH